KNELGPEGTLRKALAGKFRLRFYRFSNVTDRIAAPESLAYGGARTDLARALRYARQDLAGVPLAGVVVLTDGAHNAGTPLTEPVLEYRADRIPVYPVGLGTERLAKDIEIGRLDLPRTVLEGASVVVDVPVSQSGFNGQTVTLDVEEDNRIVSRQEVRLGDGPATARVHLTASTPGSHRYRFSIRPQEGELVRENNAREALISVESKSEKILHVEGEPRFEVKFLRRAVAGDSNLQVVTLQRTAEGKFLRLGVDSADELIAGFPRTREELFRYRGIILGSVEASFFTHDQLAMIDDFVSERGGGLLVLGGRLSYAVGGYPGTALASLLPVELAPKATGDTSSFFAEVKVEPTPVGLAHPALQISDNPDSSAARWPTLPELSVLNPVTQAKPGASTLLTGVSENGNRYIVMAWQRYGRGKVIAFPVQDSWIWQMHADIPLEDQTHETLWRQLLRWLVSYVPEPVSVTLSTDQVEVGEALDVMAEVRDSAYSMLNGADVMAAITDPTGAVDTIPLTWAVQTDGEYHAEYTPERAGPYQVEVTARRGGTPVGRARASLQAGPIPAEYFGAGMRGDDLRSLAAETGGRFYTADDLDKLAEDVQYTEAGTTVRETRDLWDAPVIFLLLLGLIGAEWTLRRKWGLA
ncbi:MAG: glutamine amidotransferase, partial [Gemmatimonadales bacterium]